MPPVTGVAMRAGPVPGHRSRDDRGGVMGRDALDHDHVVAQDDGDQHGSEPQTRPTTRLGGEEAEHCPSADRQTTRVAACGSSSRTAMASGPVCHGPIVPPGKIDHNLVGALDRLHAASRPSPIPRSNPRSNWAFRATTIVEKLMSRAPTAGARVKPTGANTPAANGIEMTL